LFLTPVTSGSRPHIIIFRMHYPLQFDSKELDAKQRNCFSISDKEIGSIAKNAFQATII